MPVVGSCGAEELANALYDALGDGELPTFPDITADGPEFELPTTLPGGDLSVTPMTNEALTTGVIGGEGTFDVVMASTHAHLKGEFEKGRITGEQYTKAYIELTSIAMQSSVQFLLGRDQAYWQSIAAQLNAQLAQTQVIEARVKLQIAKAQLQMVLYERLTAKATYALTKMKLSTESIGYCTAKYTLDELLPNQKIMLLEQIEERRAQTLNTRTDGAPVAGVIGKQRDLYDQQITSYKRDAENKVAKIFSDAWITMKTLDEGLLPPSNFTNASLDDILLNLKTNAGLVTP